MNNPQVSIVVLNWNGLESTKQCIENLKHLDYPNVEIILVDNGSHDGSKNELPKILAKIDIPYKYLDLPKNTGFTGGNIAAAEVASGEILFLLNNDAVIDPKIITEAVKIFSSDPKIGAVGGKAFFWDKNNPLFDEKNRYYSYQVIDPLTAEVTTLEEGLSQCEPNNVSGSAVFVKKSVINKVGYLDERFFAYYEESDLFARMKRAGFKVIYSPNIKIWHKVGESTKDKPGFFYYLIFRNQFLYAYKNFDKAYLRKFLRYYLYTFFVKSVVFSLSGRDRTVNLARLKSFCWNLTHIYPTIRARRKLLKLYGDGLSGKLISEVAQPISVLIDAVEASYQDLDKTLASLDKQSVCPREVIVATSQDMLGKTSPRKYRLRQVINKGIFEVAPLNLACICSNEKWIVFLRAGDSIEQDYLKTSLLVALHTKADIIYPSQINNHITPKNFKLRDFKKRNTIGRAIFVSRHSMRAVGGLDNSLESHDSIWKFIASSIMLTRSKIRQAPTKVLVLDEDHYADLQPSFTYPEFERLSPFRFWVWTSAKPIGHALHRAKNIKLISKPLIFLKVLLANTRVGFLKDKETVGLVKIFILGVRLNIRSVRHALISNYELYKEYKIAKDVVGDSDVPFDVESLPVFINCRDRVKDLKKLVDWLHDCGIRKIALVDNDSTYPELLDYYGKTHCQVLPLGSNRGQKAPWESLAIEILAKNSYYVVSDPDIVPINECPSDAINYFHQLLQKHHNYLKAGFGLKIDDLPAHYNLRTKVTNWEKQFWQNELEHGVYIADIDTTFALYRPKTWYFLEHSLRTGPPYIALHTAWYQNSKKPTREEIYYQSHASRAVNTWNMEDIPDHFKAAIAEADF